MIQCVDIQQRSTNVRGPGVTLCLMSMRRREATLSDFILRCVEIQQRLPNVGKTISHHKKDINEEIRDHF
jgi:hypothetical protein